MHKQSNKLEKARQRLQIQRIFSTIFAPEFPARLHLLGDCVIGEGGQLILMKG